MSELKEKIINIVKFFLFVFVHFIGFWFGYAFVWFSVGLPQTSWALWICFALALASEYGYMKWLENGW